MRVRYNCGRGSAMDFSPSVLPDVVLIRSVVLADDRGYLMESYRAAEFAAAGISQTFVQENTSHSRQGTLRGLHYQLRQVQGKLIRVLLGAIYDVAVDLRRTSPTFGQWVGVELSADNGLQMWIPPGFAHGLYTLSPEATVIYKLTGYYAPEWERSLQWNDPQVHITWPLVDGRPPRLSPRDAAAPPLAQVEVFA